MTRFLLQKSFLCPSFQLYLQGGNFLISVIWAHSIISNWPFFHPPSWHFKNSFWKDTSKPRYSCKSLFIKFELFEVSVFLKFKPLAILNSYRCEYEMLYFNPGLILCSVLELFRLNWWGDVKDSKIHFSFAR